MLVFTKNATVGAAEGVAALQASAPVDATFEVSADASKFTDAGLAPYKAVVFLNTAGDLLNTEQEAALQQFVQAGNGFLASGNLNGATYALQYDLLADFAHQLDEFFPSRHRHQRVPPGLILYHARQRTDTYVVEYRGRPVKTIS